MKKLKTIGLRHVALNVFDVAACADFYQKNFNMEIEWQPDPDNIYLTSGNDNLALHRVEKFEVTRATQRLDHIGFFVDSAEAVDEWFLFLKNNDVNIMKEPKTHRDGARSFYCTDPEGTVIQLIHIQK
ncbi:MAG: glyoxalase [Gammaproteobacteria bacterium CG_4_10_14_0_8_um_filter_38_16]|nr:MAG: glyoxalase [Gammaproteobacteria bacterium CG_4_10_14_0_8_um_filter_38_16]PJA03874.1 MAG: glyoxalase [Gammaproteobacteria bacterium CG_4_10_14_0_2_um_filter_38_22]PJB09512.1 MAG: glyoxalase [Gammaproteobacteria bacterium CG_4_9_14_3_um_filter_38_9]